jgi:hypothetical protein
MLPLNLEGRRDNVLNGLTRWLERCRCAVDCLDAGSSTGRGSACHDLYRAWPRLQDAISSGADSATISSLQRRYERAEQDIQRELTDRFLFACLAARYAHLSPAHRESVVDKLV